MIYSLTTYRLLTDELIESKALSFGRAITRNALHMIHVR